MWRTNGGPPLRSAVLKAVTALVALAATLALGGGAASAQEQPAEVGSALGKIAVIPEGVPLEIQRDTGLDIGAVCGKVVASFVATAANTVITATDNEAGFSLYTVDGKIDADNAELAVDRCNGSTWGKNGLESVYQRVDTNPGERYWLSWYQEDNTETIAINGKGLLSFVPTLQPNLDYITEKGGPHTTVNDCGHVIIGSFIASDPITELWVADFETFYSLYVDESGLSNPTVDDLTQVADCDGYINGYTFLEEPSRGYQKEFTTEPGVRYYLGWSQDDVEERFMLDPVNPLRRPLDDVPLIVEREEVKFTNGDGLDLDVENGCGRLAARFTPTVAFNRIFTTDNETRFNVYTMPDPRRGVNDTPQLVFDRCSLANWVAQENPTGAGSFSQRLILEPGVTYWIAWSQEDAVETFVIDATNNLDTVPELVLDRPILQPRASLGPIATAGQCVHEIIGSFVAQDDSFDIWATDNEQNLALYVDDSGLAEPRSGDLTDVSGCRGDWHQLDLFGEHISFATTPGVRYYLGWYQEDVDETVIFDTSDPLHLPPRAMPVVSCLAGSGRVDVVVTNPTLEDATYRLEFEGLSPRERDVTAGATERLTVTGRAPGSYDVAVQRDGSFLMATAVVIDCDDPKPTDPEVRVLSSCLNGSGLVRFQFVNPTDQPRSYVIHFDDVPNRSTTAAAFGQALRGTSGRPGGVHNAQIFVDGTLIAEPTVRVNCSPY